MKLTRLLSYAVLIIFLFSIPLFIKNNYFLHILIIAGVNIMLASGLRAISTAGPPSLGHVGFMAVGAYVSALMVTKLGFSFWATLPLGGVAAMILALLVGYPFIRARGVFFVMLTLFLGEAIRLTISNWRTLTGGTTGIMGIPAPNPISIPGLFTISFDSKVQYYYLALVLVLITVLILYRIDRSRVGLTLRAIQQSDFVAESVGINVSSYKVFIFGVGCFFAGLAGSFYAHYLCVLVPDTFNMMFSLYILVYVIVGGRGSLWGAIFGAIILTLIPEIFRMVKEYQPYFFVTALMLIIFLMPDGLAGLPSRIRSRIRRSRKEGFENA